jgi:hypothetical protein
VALQPSSLGGVRGSSGGGGGAPDAGAAAAAAVAALQQVKGALKDGMAEAGYLESQAHGLLAAARNEQLASSRALLLHVQALEAMRLQDLLDIFNRLYIGRLQDLLDIFNRLYSGQQQGAGLVALQRVRCSSKFGSRTGSRRS